MFCQVKNDNLDHVNVLIRMLYIVTLISVLCYQAVNLKCAKMGSVVTTHSMFLFH